MDEAMTDLARRLVASPRWRWMPGMLATADGWLGTPRVVDVDVDGTPDLWMYRGYSRGPMAAHSTGDTTAWGEVASDALPDLTDPATVGCLLALVREAWGDRNISVARATLGGWIAASSLGNSLRSRSRYFTGATEAEALVEALLFAEVLP